MAEWPYNTQQWQRLRLMVLRDQPYCVMCNQVGRMTDAEVVDHIKPVADYPDLAFTVENLQSICKKCHDSTKQRMERSGKVVGSRLDGSPVDPGHHWHGGGASD